MIKNGSLVKLRVKATYGPILPFIPAEGLVIEVPDEAGPSLHGTTARERELNRALLKLPVFTAYAVSRKLVEAVEFFKVETIAVGINYEPEPHCPAVTIERAKEG